MILKSVAFCSTVVHIFCFIRGKNEWLFACPRDHCSGICSRGASAVSSSHLTTEQAMHKYVSGSRSRAFKDRFNQEVSLRTYVYVTTHVLRIFLNNLWLSVGKTAFTVVRLFSLKFELYTNYF